MSNISNIAISTKRQEATARGPLTSPVAASRQPELFLLSSVEPVFEQAPPPVSPGPPGNVAPTTPPTKTQARASDTFLVLARGGVWARDAL